jgi:plastocyanin
MSGVAGGRPPFRPDNEGNHRMHALPSSPQPSRGSRRSRLLAVVLAVVAVLVAGSALLVRAQLDPGPPVSGVTEVVVRDNEFIPPSIAVSPGTTVTWRWEGEQAHDVVGDGFASPIQAEGEFSHTFSERGTFDYRCTLHAFMRGRVVVE